MNCSVCGAKMVEKQNNGTIKFDCGGYLHTNGVTSCNCMKVGQANRHRVMREYYALKGEEYPVIDNSEWLATLESLVGKKHTESNKDGSVGAWHRRTKKRPQVKNYKR